MKRRMYNEYEAMDSEGNCFAFIVRRELKPILEKFAIEFSLIDIEHIALSELHCICAELRIREAIEKRKGKKDATQN